MKPAGHRKGEKGKNGRGKGGRKVDKNDSVDREVDDSVVEVGKKRKGVTGTDDSAAGEQKNTIDGDHVILAQTNTGDGVEEVDEVKWVNFDEYLNKLKNNNDSSLVPCVHYHSYYQQIVTQIIKLINN